MPVRPDQAGAEAAEVEDFPEAASAAVAAARSKDLVAVLPVRTFVVKYEYRQKQNGPCHNSTGRPG